MSMNPRYPIYIVSKNRWDSRMTSKALEVMKVPYYIVVEEEQYDQYCSVIDKEKVLILPKRYFAEYEVCDDLGLTKSTGPGAARNFAWDHSISNGFARHWVMDDNIKYFARLNQAKRIQILSGAGFRAMEDFCDRYTNIAMAGPNYTFFAVPIPRLPPFVMNTRIYSCNLIQNDVPFRWRGRYNEDTDLSLRMLKKGYCTVQFNTFLQAKAGTQTVKGGNTADFYAKEGTYPKSKMLLDLHPDVTTMKMKYGRWHHQINYIPYQRKNKLLKKKIDNPTGVDNYGLELKQITHDRNPTK